MAIRRSVLLGMVIALTFLVGCTLSPTTRDVPCSTAELIAAIDNANISSATTNTINLEANCNYVLDDMTHSDDGISVLPTITTPMVINGNGATLQLQKTKNYPPPPPMRIFYISVNGELSLTSLQLESVVISGTHPGRDNNELGGAIKNDGVLNIEGVEFNENFAEVGGAIYNTGILTVENSIFAANSAETDSGAIYSDGTVSLTNTTFMGNYIVNGRGKYGGAIHQIGELLTINNCSFNSNRAFGSFGGGAIAQIGGALSITGSVFNQNEQVPKDPTYSNSTPDGLPRDSGGGAIFLRNVNFSVEESIFEYNSTTNLGGAISFSTEAWAFDANANPLNNNGFVNSAEGSTNPAGVIINNCEFNGNEALDGSAIHQDDGSMSITFSEFTGNHGLSSFPSSAIYALGDELQIRASLFENNDTQYGSLSIWHVIASIENSTFSNNTGPILVRGGNTSIIASTIVNNPGATPGLLIDPVSNLVLNIENSIVANNSGGDCDFNPPGQNIQGSFNAAGQNLDSDGSCPGFTITADPLLEALADNGGPTMTHALMAGSLAINSAIGPCLSTDQRTFGRPTTGCDIGAYEDSTLLSQIPEHETGSIDPSVLESPTPEDPVIDNCDLFEELETPVTMLDIAPGSTFQTVYLTIPGGVPGLELEIAEDPGHWQYHAALGSAEAEECTFEGYAERLYCTFELSTAALGTVQELFVYLNDCPEPFFHHPRVSIFEPAPLCTAELEESACIAVGGEIVHINDTLDMCDCP